MNKTNTKRTPARRKTKERARRPWWARIILWLMALGLIGALVGTAALAGLFFFHGRDPSLPRMSSVRDYQPKMVTRIFDRHRILVGEISAERRTVVSYGKIPKLLVQAVVAAEDADFFKHRGLDYMGMLRAFFANLRAGRFAPGRQHHHPAGGQDLLPLAGADDPAQGPGGDPGPAVWRASSPSRRSSTSTSTRSTSGTAATGCRRPAASTSARTSTRSSWARWRCSPACPSRPSGSRRSSTPSAAKRRQTLRAGTRWCAPSDVSAADGPAGGRPADPGGPNTAGPTTTRRPSSPTSSARELVRTFGERQAVDPGAAGAHHAGRQAAARGPGGGAVGACGPWTRGRATGAGPRG